MLSAAVPSTDRVAHRVLLVTLLHRYLNQTRYTATFGRVYRSPDNNWGVIGAVATLPDAMACRSMSRGCSIATATRLGTL